MPHRLAALLILCLMHVQPALAIEKVIASVPSASVVGRGVLSYTFWDIYEATLYAPQGVWSYEAPYALSLKYFRAIQGRDIADVSVQEMRKQGFSDEVQLAAWHAQMKLIFPDVQEGTILSAVYTPHQHTSFYNGDALIGVIKGQEFAQFFFGIWLSDKTSSPELRRLLLGMS